MVLLYKDPKGELVTDNTITPSIPKMPVKESVLQLGNYRSRSKTGTEGQESLEGTQVAETSRNS